MTINPSYKLTSCCQVASLSYRLLPPHWGRKLTFRCELLSQDPYADRTKVPRNLEIHYHHFIKCTEDPLYVVWALCRLSYRVWELPQEDRRSNWTDYGRTARGSPWWSPQTYRHQEPVLHRLRASRLLRGWCIDKGSVGREQQRISSQEHFCRLQDR